MTADAWGIVSGYHDALGAWRETPPETRAALLAAMGVDPRTEDRGLRTEEDLTSVRVLRRDPDAIPHSAFRIPQWDGPAELTLEDGTVLRADHALPPDLPYGYHDLRPLHGRPPVRLIVSPGRCHLPEPLRAWGWAVQLYAARSAQSWGIGDLADLRRLARWSRAELGAGVLLVSPLHAAAPVLPQEPSPYYPSSRRYRNPLYLRVEEVPGAAEAGLDIERLAVAGRALNRERRIDRDAVFRLKMAALERIWVRTGCDPAFDRFNGGAAPGIECFQRISRWRRVLGKTHQRGRSVSGIPQGFTAGSSDHGFPQTGHRRFQGATSGWRVCA